MDDNSLPGSRTQANYSYQDRKNPSKFIFIILFLILLAGVGFGIWKFFLSSESNTTKTITITPSPTEFQFPTDTPTPQISPDLSPTSSTAKPTSKPTTAPTTKPTSNPVDSSTGLDRSTLSVEVQNGSGVTGAAAKAADILRGFGYKIASAGNAANNDYVNVTIQVKSTKSNFLPLLKKDLGFSYTIGTTSADLSSSSTADALVIVGK